MAYTDYASLFPAAEQKYHLPPGTLSGVGYVESHYNPNAVSPKGAQGMMQFMPATAKGVGLSNPFDPASSVDAAGNLLSQNMKATGGNLRSALMMYNAGTNPAKWNPSYADNVLSHAQQPQAGGPPPMPPRTPPMSLGAMMGQQAPVNLGDPAPVNTDAMGTSSLVPQGNSLGAMAQSLPGIPTKAPSKFTAGNILGVLGDALSAYGGRAPTFGPFLQQEKMIGQQQDFEREKFNQELKMRMFAMMHPEEMMKAQAFHDAPQSVRESMVEYADTMDPKVVGVQQPNGSIINQVQPRHLAYQPGDIHPGTDGNYQFMGGDPTDQASWKKVQ